MTASLITSPGAVTRILVIEDNRDDELLLIRVLKQANMDRYVRVIGDGQEAVDYLASEFAGADLVAIFLDLHLPHISGIEVLKKMRTLPRISDLPVIVMSSSPSPIELKKCKELGVSHYLPKPVTLPIFKKALADTFHRIQH